MGYRHLTIDERESILKMLSEQKDMTHIAESIGRDKGTISRELSRNRCSTGEYKPHLAQRYYTQRRDASKQPYRIEQNGRLRQYVRNKLKLYWPPEQIAARLEIDHSDAPQMRISPLVIYNWIQRDKTKYLRQGHRKRRKKRGDYSEKFHCQNAKQ